MFRPARHLIPMRIWIPALIIFCVVALERLYTHSLTHELDFWYRWLEYAGGMALLFLVVLSLYYFLILRRINHLLTVVKQLALGDLRARVNLQNGDEFALLGKNINEMATQLAITLDQQQHVEEKLRYTTELLQGLLINIDSIAWSIQPDQPGFTYISASVEQVYGYPVEAFQNDPNLWFTVIHPDDRDRVLIAQQAMDITGSKDSCYRVIARNGAERWIHDRAYLIRDTEGKPIRLDGLAVDITTTKATQEALAERTRLAVLRADIGLLLGQRNALSTTLQQCAATIADRLDVTIVRIWCYNEAQRQLELQAGVGLHTELTEKYHVVPLGQSLIGRIAQGVQSYLSNAVLTDPFLTEKAWAERERIVAFAGYPLIIEERMVGVMVIFSRTPLSQAAFEDLSAVAGGIAQLIERKRTEEALMLSEEKLRLAIEGAQDGIWDINWQTGETTFSHQWSVYLGYGEEELRLTAENWKDLIHPSDQAHVIAALESHRKGESAVVEVEMRVRTKAGDWKWILNRGKIVACDTDGRPLRLSGTSKDISERKQAEQMLQNFFRISPDLLTVAKMESTIRFVKVNPAFEQLLGYTPQEMHAHTPLGYIHPDDRDDAVAALEKLTIRNGIEHHEIARFENRFRRADGSYLWISWQATAGQDDGLIYAVGRDITAAKQLSILMAQTHAAAHIGGWELNYRTNELYWTEETFRIHDTSPDEYTPSVESAVAFYAPESIPLLAAALERGRTEGKPWDLELPLITAKGQRVWVHVVGKIQWENGSPLRAYGSVQDITQRKATEIALRQSEAKNRAILEALPDLVFICDENGTYLDVPKGEGAFPQLDITSTLGKRVDQVLPAPYGEQALVAIQKAARGEQQILEHALSLNGEKPMHVEARISPMDENRVIIIIRDVTEQKQLEEERSIRKIAEAVPHLMFVYDLVEERHLYINNQVLRDLGYTPEEFLALNGEFVNAVLHPDDSQRFPELRNRWGYARDGEVFETEYRMRHVNGEWRWFLGRDTVFTRTLDGAVHQIIGTAQDITAIKNAQHELLAALSEKDALLKEVHHRVKNNLQIISSLLNLQSAQIKEAPVLDIFNETKNRVRSMALLHETLYRTENLAAINFQYYVTTLCSYLFRSYGISSHRITLQTRIGDVRLEMEQAIPCGLIINELVSNALKYAFPNDREGRVGVEVMALANGSLQLCVCDNGVGLPADFDVKRAESLGLRIVHDLATQLRGTLSLEQTNGTAFILTF